MQAALAGTTAAFDARGRLLAWHPAAAGTVVLQVPRAVGRTPYDALGDWVPAGSVALLVAALVGLSLPEARKARTERHRWRRSGIPAGTNATSPLHRGPTSRFFASRPRRGCAMVWAHDRSEGPAADDVGPGPEGGGETHTVDSAASGAPGSTPGSGSRGGGRLRGPVLVASVVAAVVGALVGVGGYALSAHVRPNTTIHVTTGAAASPARATGTVSGAAGVIGPSVVTINVTGSQGAGTGSGVVLSGSGNVLTNNHVVTLDASTAAAANQISVTLSDGSSHGASVVGTDPVDDLAVIRITGGGSFTAATFATSSALHVGQGSWRWAPRWGCRTR